MILCGTFLCFFSCISTSEAPTPVVAKTLIVGHKIISFKSPERVA